MIEIKQEVGGPCFLRRTLACDWAMSKARSRGFDRPPPKVYDPDDDRAAD
jgi:hypothetical protein